MKRRLSRSVPNGRMLLTLLTAICVGVLASAGVGLASTPLTVPLNNNTAPQGTPGECTTNGTLLTNDWHFVISPNNGSSAFVTFHLALVNPTETYDTSVFIPNGAQTDNVFVAVPSGHVLTDLQTGGSTADISWDGSPPTPTKFQLSHICGSVAVTPTVVTQIHLDPGHTTVTEVALGDKVHDSATVSSATGTPTGSVDFKFYSGPCGDDSNPIGAPSTLALVNGVADPSAASPALAAGSYHYTAHYNSDNTAKWTDAEATCEPLTVDKAQLSIVTQIHNANHDPVGGATDVPLGSVVHDTATVSGAVPNFPIGAVTFTLNGSAVANDPTPDGTATARSVDSAPLAAGSYTYKASVAGNANYIGATSADEPLMVDKARLSIVTQIHNASHQTITNTNVPVGTVVHDTATVSGAVPGFAIGAVSFTLNGSAVANDPAPDGTATARSEDSAPLAAGSYKYAASVAGNDNYIGASSGDEPLTVDPAQLSIVTQIHNANHDPVGGATDVPLGSVVHDTATVSGAVPNFPIGAVTFTLNGSAVANDPTPDGTATARSVDSAPLAAGSYTYKASVAGNANYIGATSADEPLMVDKARLSIVTQIHNASHQTITNTNVPVGTVVHDTATVSGAVPGFAIGAVSFTLNGSAVANDPAPDGTATARSEDSAPLAAGSYTYRASVAGNANYIGATSADEPLSVRTFGKTMGFWGNTNGQASLPDNPNVTLGTVSASTCSIIVNTKAISKVILPNTKNGVSILTNCTTTASRDPGINTESLNTLLAQTLALSFNILYIQGYTGQTIGGMNCTPVGSLTLASTVQAARDYANGLIANASLGGTVVTQSQIGALNTLLGCLNRES